MKRECDLVAELGQLTAQGDPYEGAAAGNFSATEPYAENPGLRPAPQLPVNLKIPEQARDAEYNDVEDQPCAVAEAYQIELPPHVRHRSLALVVAITSIALVGTAGTFAYREMFGGSVLPMPPPIICSGLQDSGGDCVILKKHLS